MSLRARIYIILVNLVGLTLILGGFLKIMWPDSYVKIVMSITSVYAVNVLLLYGIPIIELTLGFMVIYNLERWYSLVAAWLLIATFTMYIVLIASSEPGDCGCFGGAIKVASHHMTMYKNILLSMTLAWLIYEDPKLHKINSTKKEFS